MSEQSFVEEESAEFSDETYWSVIVCNSSVLIRQDKNNVLITVCNV